MKVTQQLQELERLAKRLGIKVSYDPAAGLVAGTGGLCRVRGSYRLIVDRRLKTGARAQVLLDALSRFDTGALEISPEIQTLLEPLARARRAERTQAPSPRPPAPAC